MSGKQIAIGLDLGTGGARAVAFDLSGELVGESQSPFPRGATHVDGPRVEQSPDCWTIAAQTALKQLTSSLPQPAEIVGISVDATSGTFLLVDGNASPLTSGLMYNDLRAAELADEVAEAMSTPLERYGIQIASSFALPKLVHIARSDPALFSRARRIVHQTDWIVAMLCGRFDVTDVSTALKTGVDPGTMTWPSQIKELGIPFQLLPRVVSPGTQVGEVIPSAAEATGLPAGVPVVAGCTDGTAGCLASGARAPGDLNVTLGTTLVFKAISNSPIIDPQGAVYNHRHPCGGYLPGAASSTGGDWVEQFFAGEDLAALNRAAETHLPTNHVVYPLVKQGERFPFACARAQGFGFEPNEHRASAFASGMEGVAFLERLAIERLEKMGLPIGSTIYATGGGSSSDVWMRIRAAVNERSYSVPRHAQCAVGAAVLAAMPCLGSCSAAIARLVRAGKTYEPHPEWVRAYRDRYPRFVAALNERGYL